MTYFNQPPTMESVLSKLEREGPLFASDEMRVVLAERGALAAELEQVKTALDVFASACRKLGCIRVYNDEHQPGCGHSWESFNVEDGVCVECELAASTRPTP